MATPGNYPSGFNLAGTVFENGPTTLQLGGGVLFSSGLVQWLSTTTGDNANAGTRPELPVATLAQAVTNFAAAPNGILIVGEGSAESLGAAQTLSLAGLMMLGCGVGSSRPRYTCTGAVSMWDITAAGVWVEGFYFPASTTAAPTNRVGVSAANGTIRDCYFECGAVDTARALRIHTGANSCYVKGCDFVTTASRPATGLEVSAAVSDATIEDCTFDGGSYGWSSYSLRVSAAALRTRLINPTFTNMSDLSFESSSNTYQDFGVDMGGAGNVLITT